MNTNFQTPQFKDAIARPKRGSVLLEAVAALVLLTVAALALLKGSLNTLAPRQWSLVQNVTDAHLTYEDAYAQRIPFDELTASGSPWPAYPNKSTTEVTLGTLPGGTELKGTVIRSRTPDAINLPAYGGSGTATTNPAESQVWQVQSHLLYKIGGRDYVKSRTTVRSR